MKKSIAFISAVSLTASLVAPLTAFAQEPVAVTTAAPVAVSATACEEQVQGILRRFIATRELKDAQGEA